MTTFDVQIELFLDGNVYQITKTVDMRGTVRYNLRKKIIKISS